MQWGYSFVGKGSLGDFASKWIDMLHSVAQHGFKAAVTAPSAAVADGAERICIVVERVRLLGQPLWRVLLQWLAM
mgnify:CR=1 FL=1